MSRKIGRVSIVLESEFIASLGGAAVDIPRSVILAADDRFVDAWQTRPGELVEHVERNAGTEGAFRVVSHIRPDQLRGLAERQAMGASFGIFTATVEYGHYYVIVVSAWEGAGGFLDWLHKLLDQISPDAFLRFQADRERAFAWYEQQDFGPYDKRSLGDLTELSIRNSEAEQGCDWHGLIAGAHHLLDGIDVQSSPGTEPGRWQVPLAWIPRSLEYLGLAHTGLASYTDAGMHLKSAARSVEFEDEGTRDRRRTSILLNEAVCAHLCSDAPYYDTVRSRLREIARPSELFASDPSEWARYLYGLGMKNLHWRVEDQPVDRCLAHAAGYFRVSIDLNRELEAYRAVAITLVHLGTACMHLGDRRGAEEAWTEARAHLASIADPGLREEAEQIMGGWQ